MALAGQDFLGLASRYWPMKETLKAALPQGTPIGLFGCDTFGPNAVKNAETLIARFNPSKIRIGLWTYHKLIGDKQLIKFIQRWEPIAAKYPQINFYFAWETEHYCKNKDVAKAKMNLIRQYGPHLIPVNNPAPGYVVLPNEVNETHGGSRMSGQYIASMDGRGFDDSSFNAKQFVNGHQNAIMTLGWCGLYNMQDGNQPTKPGQQPLRKAGPSAKYINACFGSTKAPGVAPTFQGGKTTEIKAPSFYKPLSQGVNDERENKPVAVVKSNEQKLNVLTFDRKKLGEFVLFSGWAPDLHKFGATNPAGSQGINLWGYEIANKAQALSGSPWVFLSDGKTVWPVAPAYRAGMFQPAGKKE